MQPEKPPSVMMEKKITGSIISMASIAINFWTL
jgi:hypothetical protein